MGGPRATELFSAVTAAAVAGVAALARATEVVAEFAAALAAALETAHERVRRTSCHLQNAGIASSAGGAASGPATVEPRMTSSVAEFAFAWRLSVSASPTAALLTPWLAVMFGTGATVSW